MGVITVIHVGPCTTKFVASMGCVWKAVRNGGGGVQRCMHPALLTIDACTRVLSLPALRMTLATGQGVDQAPF